MTLKNIDCLPFIKCKALVIICDDNYLRINYLPFYIRNIYYISYYYSVGDYLPLNTCNIDWWYSLSKPVMTIKCPIHLYNIPPQLVYINISIHLKNHIRHRLLTIVPHLYDAYIDTLCKPEQYYRVDTDSSFQTRVLTTVVKKYPPYNRLGTISFI